MEIRRADRRRHLVYQIFVDRFAGPEGRPLPAPPDGVDPWRHHAGGTLDGIAHRLDHLASLGVDLLYLTPIFRAPSNHKYDTASFEEVDPRFGGEAAFDRLAGAARERGIGLVLDGVFNHVGEEHGWFRDACRAATSPFFRFFRFARHPDRYDRWRGMGWLPELDLARDDVRRALAESEGAPFRRWLRRGATGWRLDCANDLGLQTCGLLARIAREEGAPDGVVGEVMAWAEAWLQEGALDGVMNYWMRETVLEAAAGRLPAAQVASNLGRMAESWRWPALLRSWNVLATHDTPRLATRLPDRRARRLARLLAFTLPGTPHLYYGEEIGMEGGDDPANRNPMEWDDARWDRETLEETRTLARLRRERVALREGRFLPMPQPGLPWLFAFARVTEHPEEATLVAVNLSGTPQRGRAFLPYSWFLDALPLADRWGGTAGGKVTGGAVEIALEPWQGVVWVPEDGAIEGYRFFKRT